MLRQFRLVKTLLTFLLPAGIQAIRNWPQTWELLRAEYRRGGVVGLWDRIRIFITVYRKEDLRSLYPTWVARYDTLGEPDRAAIRLRIKGMTRRPSVCILLPADAPNGADSLKRSADSVLQQLYPHWVLQVVSGWQDTEQLAATLETDRVADPRVRLVAHPGVSVHELLNRVVAAASEDWVAVLGEGVHLAEHALFRWAEAVEQSPAAEILYSDGDRVDAVGRRHQPFFKPDWDPDRILEQNLLDHFVVVRRERVLGIGGFREGFGRHHLHDLVLRCTDGVTAGVVHHVPHVLYHCHATQQRCSDPPASCREDASSSTTAAFFREKGVAASVEWLKGNNRWRVRYSLPADPPLVSVIVPTRDRWQLLKNCLAGVLDRTAYPKVEVLVVDNRSEEPQTYAYLDSLRHDSRVRVLPYSAPFNYSAMNNLAALEARGEVLCLLNNDIEVINPDWLSELVSHALRPEVGVVGARLSFPDGTIQHAGVALGCGHVAGHLHSGWPRDRSVGYGETEVLRNFLAVTAACLAVRRSVFHEVGGFDATAFPVRYNDVDLCLRIRSRGYRVLWSPYAELVHHESASLGRIKRLKSDPQFLKEVQELRSRWPEYVARDPFHNPNLDLLTGHYLPAFPPRVLYPWASTRTGQEAK
jgi:GT2 family glycosyltransferase